MRWLKKNGIPYGLINRAKKKIASGKVRFDKTIANLQKERSGLRNLKTSLQKQEQQAKIKTEELAETQQKVKDKLERYQEVFDANQRLLVLGRKVDQLAERYYNKWTKKGLLDALFKLIMQENNKRKPKTKLKPVSNNTPKAGTAKAKGASSSNKKSKGSSSRRTNNKDAAFDKELKLEVAQIRATKKAKKKKEIESKPEEIVVFNLGDRVRMIDGVAVGTIDKIEKNKLVVNYGIFTTTVKKEYIEKA